MKHEGFRWAPSAGAWQRQLNERALYAADHLECVRPLSGELPSALQRRVQSEQAAPAETPPTLPEQETETEPESGEVLPDEAAQPEPETDEITPEMIAEGFDNGSVSIVDSPNEDGAVCLIE